MRRVRQNMRTARLRPRPTGLTLCAAGLAFALACQTSPKPESRSSASRFPSESELSKLPPPPSASQLGVVTQDDIGAWTLTGPFPERVEMAPHAAASPFEVLLSEAAAGRSGLAVTSQAMHCAAREVGAFILERQRPPPVALLDFMAARCGAVGASFRQAWYHGDVPSSVSDEELFSRWKPEVEKLIGSSLGGGAVAAGVWFGRDGSRAVVSLVSTLRQVLIAPVSPVVAGDQIALSGEVLMNVEEISANVNQGRLGYAACEMDAAVALPRFALRCPLAADDATAIVEVGLREPGRMLGISALRILVRRPNEPADRWQRAAGSSELSAEPGDFAQQVAAALGRVRAGEELRPLGLSLPQSEAANELAPYVFAGSMGAGSPALADLAVLGLYAGWQVGGVVKNAALTSGMSASSLDASSWLATALERPSARAALLDPEARVLAIGTLASEDPPIAAALAVTYRLFGEENLPAEATRFFERVAKAREARGRTPPARLGSAAEVVQQVASELSRRNIEPRAALDDALARATASSSQPVQGWVLEATSIDDAQLPGDLVDAQSLRLAVGVGYYQPPAEPWGRYVVLILTAAQDVGI
jgi:hypothetical protein